MGERPHPRAATPPPFQESNPGTLEPSGHCLSFSMLRNFLTSKTGNNVYHYVLCVSVGLL